MMIRMQQRREARYIAEKYLQRLPDTAVLVWYDVYNDLLADVVSQIRLWFPQLSVVEVHHIAAKAIRCERWSRAQQQSVIESS